MFTLSFINTSNPIEGLAAHIKVRDYTDMYGDKQNYSKLSWFNILKIKIT
jgi:hypothetical protein